METSHHQAGFVMDDGAIFHVETERVIEAWALDDDGELHHWRNDKLTPSTLAASVRWLVEMTEWTERLGVPPVQPGEQYIEWLKMVCAEVNRSELLKTAPKFAVDRFLDSIKGQSFKVTGLFETAKAFALSYGLTLTNGVFYGNGKVDGILQGLKKRMTMDDSGLWTYIS